VALVDAVPIVAAAADTVIVPELIWVPVKVLLQVRVWVPARIANSLVVFGRVKIRVVSELMPDKSNSALLVRSASSIKVEAVSANRAASSTRISDIHDPVLKISEVSVASFQASQPSFGAWITQGPSCQAAIWLARPAQRPFGAGRTIQRWPSAGEAGSVEKPNAIALAVTAGAEVDDSDGFESPRPLMAYLRLT
jgi:hypothetical protein